MSADIVDRLRIESKATYPEGKYLGPVMREAADEIERLRAEIEPMRKALEIHAGYAAEAERLRTALGWIEDHSIDPIVVRKASAALKGEP